MAMDSVSIWKAQWDLLPLDPTGSAYPINVANFCGDRVDGKMTVATPVVGSTSFTFNRAVMAAQIAGLVPSVTPLAGAIKIADAWQLAVLASVFVVNPGTFIGSAALPTTWSVIFTALPITAAGYVSLIAGLIAAPLAGDPGQSSFPEELQKAFSLLTYTVTGLDSQLPPPAGPGPQSLIYVTSVV